MIKYTIPKGSHKSKGCRFLLKRPTKIRFKIDESFINEATNNPKQGWSKLFGYSDSVIHHHRNSIRIGLIVRDGQIFAGAYYYNNGERGWTTIKKIEPNVEYEAEISWTKKTYIVAFGESFSIVPRTGKLITYPLFPYFGGVFPAPKDVFIYIEYLN
jgi:hypothetical protein